MLRNGGSEGLSTDPNALRTGMHGGYQVINLAVLAGAESIILLGYDGKKAGDKTHFFGDHPEREIDGAYEIYRKTLRKLPPLLGDVRCVNCSPDSAVDAFPRMSLEGAFCALGI